VKKALLSSFRPIYWKRLSFMVQYHLCWCIAQLHSNTGVIVINPNPNLNNLNHNHTLRTENSLELLHLSIPGDWKYHIQCYFSIRGRQMYMTDATFCPWGRKIQSTVKLLLCICCLIDTVSWCPGMVMVMLPVLRPQHMFCHWTSALQQYVHTSMTIAPSFEEQEVAK